MILYRLQCAANHEFDAWFSSGAAYDAQAAAGEVACPVCGSLKVGKAIMAPRVARAPSESAPSDTASSEKQPVFHRGTPPNFARMAAALRDHVEKTCDYVGPDFPEEARRIHYGESDARGIYGEATGEETKALIEEGIEVSALPGTPKRKSN